MKSTLGRSQGDRKRYNCTMRRAIAASYDVRQSMMGSGYRQPTRALSVPLSEHNNPLPENHWSSTQDSGFLNLLSNQASPGHKPSLVRYRYVVYGNFWKVRCEMMMMTSHTVSVIRRMFHPRGSVHRYGYSYRSRAL